MKQIENKSEYYTMGLDDVDIENLNIILNKIKYQGSQFIKNFDEDEHIDLQCEPTQYEEEALQLWASYVLR
jgi:hypothetical protein